MLHSIITTAHWRKARGKHIRRSPGLCHRIRQNHSSRLGAKCGGTHLESHSQSQRQGEPESKASLSYISRFQRTKSYNKGLKAMQPIVSYSKLQVTFEMKTFDSSNLRVIHITESVWQRILNSSWYSHSNGSDVTVREEVDLLGSLRFLVCLFFSLRFVIIGQSSQLTVFISWAS